MNMNVGMPHTSLKLRPSLWKWTLIGLVFLALAGGMALLYASSPTEDPSGESLVLVGSLVGFFGLGAFVSLWMLLPNSVYLLLTPGGFTIRTLLKRKEYRWEEIEHFQSITLKGAPWVVFTLLGSGKVGRAETRLGWLNKAVSGGDDNLPDTYGMSAEKLAELMNQWKKRFGG